MAASSRGPPAVDLLWAYQLKKEHAYLKGELDSVKDRSLKAQRAAEAAHAASRVVSELRKDLDEHVNNAQELERNRILGDHLNEHTKQLATLNTRLNGLGDVMRSNEDDVDRLDGKCNALEMKWNRFEERIEKLEKSLASSVNKDACEALLDRTKALEHRVDRLTENVAQAVDIRDMLQSFQERYDNEISQLKQAFAEMQEDWQKAKSEMPPGLQKPQVLQVEAPAGPSLLDTTPPDTFSNFSWGYPSVGMGVQEHCTHQQAQIPRFPEPAMAETQATTQLDDSYSASGTMSGPQEMARIRPQQYEQATPRKRQKLSQDTQGEKLRQMLRGNELAIEKRRAGGKQQGNAPLTSYEATQRLEPPKLTAHTMGARTDTPGDEATQLVEPPIPAVRSKKKEVKKPESRAAKKTTGTATKEAHGKTSITSIGGKQNQQKKIQIDLTKAPPPACTSRSNRYRRSSTLQVLEHTGRGIKGCYARAQPKLEGPPGETPGTTATATEPDKPPTDADPKRRRRPIRSSRTALVKLAIPREKLQALAATDKAGKASQNT